MDEGNKARAVAVVSDASNSVFRGSSTVDFFYKLSF